MLRAAPVIHRPVNWDSDEWHLYMEQQGLESLRLRGSDDYAWPNRRFRRANQITNMQLGEHEKVEA